MRTLPYLPVLFVVALLGLLAVGAVGPAASFVSAEEAGEEGEDDEPGDFYEDETTFSGDQVTKAINLGVAWLKKKQGSDGSWGAMKGNSTYGGGQGGNEQFHAGPTALALYALLKCKAEMKDPVIRKGFAYLQNHHKRPASSYEASMILLAITATADNAKMSKTRRERGEVPKLRGRFRRWASETVDYLVKKRTARGWRYNYEGKDAAPGGPEDVSSTQLAALALFAAHRMGMKVRPDVWEDILSFTLEQQEAEGPPVVYQDPVDPKNKRTAMARGFAYIKNPELKPDEYNATGGMTACGIANVEMARFVLTDGGKDRDRWNKRSDAAKVQTSIYDALAWLEKNWSPFENPRKKTNNVYHVYWLYALERAMDLLDLKLVGSHNWYNEMGQELLNRQASDGHWDTRSGLDPSDTCDTCFALLFLKRATKGSIPFGDVTGGTEEPPADNR